MQGLYLHQQGLYLHQQGLHVHPQGLCIYTHRGCKITNGRMHYNPEGLHYNPQGLYYSPQGLYYSPQGLHYNPQAHLLKPSRKGRYRLSTDLTYTPGFASPTGDSIWNLAYLDLERRERETTQKKTRAKRERERERESERSPSPCVTYLLLWKCVHPVVNPTLYSIPGHRSASCFLGLNFEYLFVCAFCMGPKSWTGRFEYPCVNCQDKTDGTRTPISPFAGCPRFGGPTIKQI